MLLLRGRLGGVARIIFDFDLLRFNTTGFVRSSSPYHPRGAPIFPVRQKSKCTKEIERQSAHDVSNEKRVHSLKSVVVSLSLNGSGVAAVGEVKWQQTPERAATETEYWRCGCAPERETAEKVRWHQTPERESAEEVGWQQTPEREPAAKVCGSRRRSTRSPRRRSGGAGARRSARPPRICVAANAGARARRGGVWQQTPERAAAETEQWRCGCAPEREATGKVCGSKRQSVSPPGRCVAAEVGARGHRDGEVEVRVRAGARDRREGVAANAGARDR